MDEHWYQETGPASIDAKDARVHWNGASGMYFEGFLSGPAKVVVSHERAKFPESDGRGEAPGARSWFGGAKSDSSWHKLSDEQRVLLLLETALEMIANHGCEPAETIRQFCKIREFYELGNESLPMRRTFWKILTGHGREDWPIDFKKIKTDTRAKDGAEEFASWRLASSEAPKQSKVSADAKS